MFTGIGLRDLAGLCHRLSTALEAGMDIRQTFHREASGRSSAALRRRFEQMAQRINLGHGISEAVGSTGTFFPPLFREMVAVGEETGKLAEVLRQLAEHYDHQIRVRRIFLAAITWPMLQLIAAVMIVGLVIWIMGFVASMNGGQAIDILGIGLVGTRGVQIYFLLIAAIVLGGIGLYQAIRRGVAGTAALQSALLRVPVIGHAMTTLALAQLAWTLHLTLAAGMGLRQAIPLALNSTRNAHFTQLSGPIVTDVMSGREICEALARTRAFPAEFLDRLEVGERSGRLPESMEILSRQYRDEANRAIAALAMVAGFVVWGLVALLIITIILRIAMFIVGIYDEALSW